MKTTSKIAIIGMGYWGKILYYNLLLQFDKKDIITYDEFKPEESSVPSLYAIEAENVFVCVTASQHYRVCEHFLKQGGVNVFCEKPLTGNFIHSRRLFELALQYDSYLFVDWLFQYNNQVNIIWDEFFYKKTLGDIQNISMNRLNKGPVRTDTNAIFDLASHDVSILKLWFHNKPNNVNWLSYKRNPSSFQDDSCVGILRYGNATAQINCSWDHNLKDRTCILGFKNGVVIWNDINQEILLDGKPFEYFDNKQTPISNVLKKFLNKTESQNHIIQNTLAIEETLNATSLSIR